MKKYVSAILMMVLLVSSAFVLPSAAAKTKFEINATSTTNSVKLKWSKVKGAKHYKVYRKTQNKKYKFIKKTTKRTFINKKLKSGKKYTYKVKAFKKNNKGKFYSFKSATKSVKTKTEKEPQTTIVVEMPTTTTTTEPTTISAEEYFNNLTPKEQLELISYDLGVDISSNSAVVKEFEPKKYMYTEEMQYDNAWGYSAKVLLNPNAYVELCQEPGEEWNQENFIDEFGLYSDLIIRKYFKKETLNLYSVQGQQWTYRYSGEKVYAYLGVINDNYYLFVTTNLSKKCKDFIPTALNKDPKDYTDAGEYLDSLTKEEQLQVIVNDTEMFIGEGTTVQNFEKIDSNICDGGYKYIAKLKLTKSGFDYFNEMLTNEDPTNNIKYVLENGNNQPWWNLNETNVVKYSSYAYNAKVSTEGIVPTIWIDFMTAEIDGEYYLFIETDHTKINEYYLQNAELPELSEHQGSLKSYFEGLNKHQLEKIIKKDFDYEIPCDSELMNIEYDIFQENLQGDNLKETWGYSAKFKLTKFGYEELSEYFADRQNMMEYILYLDPQEQDINYSWWDATKEDVIFIDETLGSTSICCSDGNPIAILGLWNHSWLAQIDGEYYLYINTPLSHTTSEWYELKNKTQTQTTTSKNYETLVKEARLKELKQNPDTAHATLDDIKIDYYFGTYNDCIVVMLWDNFTTVNCAMYDVYVEGVKFTYSDNRRARVLKDGVFYSLQQAYDNGFLSYDDLVSIGSQTTS